LKIEDYKTTIIKKACPMADEGDLLQKRDSWSGMLYFVCARCGKKWRLIELD
jgi:hypothetical protein